MSKLAEIIDSLECDVINLIDDLEFYEHVGGSAARQLKDELNNKRHELLNLKNFFDQINSEKFLN